MNRLVPLALLAVAAVGCSETRWTTTAARPLPALVVTSPKLSGTVDPALVQQRQQALVASLRQRGYDVFESDDAKGLPRIEVSFAGDMIDDSQMHAPDDARHHIRNNLYYHFVAYHVGFTVVGADGRVVAQGSAESDRDPAGAIRALEHKLFADVPPAAETSTPTKLARNP